MPQRELNPIGKLLIRFSNPILAAFSLVWAVMAVFVLFDDRQPNPYVDSAIMAAVAVVIYFVVRPLTNKLAVKAQRQLEEQKGDEE